MRKRFIYLLFLLFFLQATGCAVEDSNIPSSRELKKHVSKLASEEFGGRLVGTDGIELAVDYAIETFESYGAKPGSADENGNPSYRQIVPMKQEVYGPENGLRVVKNGEEKWLAWGQDCIFSYKDLETEDYPSNPNPVWVGYGFHDPEQGWDDFKGLDTKDRWLLHMMGQPQDKAFPEELREKYGPGLPAIQNRAVYFKEAGAGAAIQVLDNYADQVWRTQVWARTLVGTHLVDDPPYPSRIDFPFVLLGKNAANWLFEGTGFDPVLNTGEYWTGEFEGLEVEIVVDVEDRDITGTNVIARVDGTDPDLMDEVLVLSAHIDHVGYISGELHPGATDNASGCAIVMGVAKAIAEMPVRRPVLFVLFTGEEVGILGSRYFVANSPLPLEQMKLDIQVDMIGQPAATPDGDVYGFVPAHYLEQFSAVDDPENYVDFFLQSHESFGQRLGSDHDSFLDQGIDGVFLGTGLFPEYHTPADKPDVVDGKLLHQMTKTLTALIMNIGNMDDLPSPEDGPANEDAGGDS